MISDILNWASAHPVILLLWWMAMLLIGGVLASRLIALAQKLLIRVYMTEPESSRWTITLIQAGTWVAQVMLWVCITVVIMSRVGVPSALIAGLGTILGAAIGFGSQETIRDIVKGTVHLMERRFAVGDLVTFSLSGNDYTGTVKDISLRSVTISTESDGDVFVPQGYVSVIKNFSSSGGFIVVMPFSVQEDLTEALPVIYDVSARLNNDMASMNDEDILTNLGAEDENLLTRADMDILRSIHSTSVRGISSVENGFLTIQVEGVTLPGNQFASRRVVLKMMYYHLQKKNIDFGALQVIADAS